MTRIKKIFTKLKQEHDRVFNQGLVRILIESARLTDEQERFFNPDETEREAFCRFY